MVNDFRLTALSQEPDLRNNRLQSIEKRLESTGRDSDSSPGGCGRDANPAGVLAVL